MVVYTSRREHYSEHLVPVHDFANVSIIAERYGVKPATVFAWFFDGREHRFRGKRIPTIVGDSIMHIFGVNKEILRAAGYTPHWRVFQDLDTGEFSFGNRPSFIKSTDPVEVLRGYAMPIVDFDEIKEL